MHSFTLKPYTAQVHSEGTLPSGEEYSSALDPPPDFTFSLDLTLDFQIDPEALPRLVSESLLTEDTFDQWHTDTSEIISSKAAAYIRERSRSTSFSDELSAMGNEFTQNLSSYLQSSLPNVTINAVNVRNIKVPDFELYTTAKEIYLEIAQARKQSYESALAELSWTEARSSQHFDVLRQYGELITQYPALLDLFELKGGALGTILEEIDAFEPPAGVESP
jgi:hypothetical protein